jgi:hypothetical protein
MKILISNGVVLQGNHPTQYVVFPPNFQNSVSTILEAFFEGLLQILDNDDKPSVPVATGGGGAALHKSSTHQSKTDKLLTNGSENKTLECVVCPHTNNDSSGKCSSRSCGLFHPINTTSVKVKSQCSESGDPFISARICCHHSTHGQCRLGNECRFAHLSSNEYERFQSQDESHPKIQNLNPIVPSQVRFGRPSHSGTHVHNLSNAPPHSMTVNKSTDSPLSSVECLKQIQGVVDVEGTAELGSELLQGSETDRILENFRSLTGLDQIAAIIVMVANAARVRK